MKKSKILALTLVLTLLLGTVAAAVGPMINIGVFPGVKISMDGKDVTPEGKEPFIYEDTTYVPLRFLSEILGVNVGWDDATKTVLLGEQTASATATVVGYEGEKVTVTVTVEGGHILNVEATSDRESPIGQRATGMMPRLMVEQNSVNIDAVSGATGTAIAVREAAQKAMAQLTEQNAVVDLDAWALANGYVKAADYNIVTGVDAVASATSTGVGGVNYGAIDWSEDLQKAAIKEFLKGGKYLGSPDYAQDETGYNYREMYQMATSFNNKPANANLELVLNVDSMTLMGLSEGGTGKINDFQRNPQVSISWCKQLRVENEESGYNYFCSYGATFNG
ncbi:MAG: FMN-binding protein, partial [Oscillospiraceae bacterium]|nr:FMN-binding protein [Oscillospiraceae bacterium]